MSNRSKVSPLGQAIIDLIETWNVAKDSDHVVKPVSYALYHVWKKWDSNEKPRNRKQEDDQ